MTRPAPIGPRLAQRRGGPDGISLQRHHRRTVVHHRRARRGKRKDRLAAAIDGVLDLFAARMPSFDTAAARRYAKLAVKARARPGKAPHAR